MKTFLVFPALIFALCFSFAAGVAMDRLSVDGTWWRQQVPEDSKIYVTAGMVEAYQTAWFDATVAEDRRIGSAFVSTVARRIPVDAASQTLKLIDAPKSPALPQFSHTLGFYEEGITDFYAVHPTAQSATVGEVLSCLQDTPLMSCDKLASVYGSSQK